MSDWSSQEAAFLRRRWSRAEVLTLRAACPHCLHDSAFADLVIYPQVVVTGGGGGAEAPADAPPAVDRWSEPAFPSHVTVACNCKATEHSPAQGCGRIGNVTTEET